MTGVTMYPAESFFFLWITTEMLRGEAKNLCNYKCSASTENGTVSRFCTMQKLQMVGRCCQDKIDNCTYGLDLRGCHISNLTGILVDYSAVKELVLEDNPFSQYQNEDFLGLKNLSYLSLPHNITCPGGDQVWEFVNYTTNKSLCLTELSTCKVENISCPDNSHCVDGGPGSTYCFCNHEYFGYKCMRKGRFMFLPFTVATVGIIGLIATLLWCFKRTHVKKE